MLPTENTLTEPGLEQSYSGLTQTLVRRRDDAVAGRKASGIEADWVQDAEYLMGVDDANRAYVRNWTASIKRGHPAQQGGDGARSTVFLNIVAPYAQAAASRVADMLLPTDDRCWSIQPTPIAEIDPQTGEQLAQAGIDWQTMQQQVQAQAEEAARRMTDAIDDALTEANWHGVVRQVIEDAAGLGTGIIKGPVPIKRTVKKWRVIDGVSQLEVAEEIKPGCQRVDPWNFYPDRACGENIHNGRDVWERSYMTARQVRELRDMPSFDSAMIDKVLSEGPKQTLAREAGDGTYVPLDKEQYECWQCYATLPAKDVMGGGLALEDDASPVVHVQAMLINDRVVKLAMNPMDSGEFPYDVLAWQERKGVPWGIGIARQLNTTQRMLNAATRAMMDNSGLTAAPQIVLGNGITPADGKFEIRGRKLWRADPEVMDVRQAFYAFIPDSHQAEFQAIINFALEMAERTTGMPALLQGQQTQVGQGANTFAGMQLLQSNASGSLRRLAKRFDDYITEPHIRRWYHWLLQYDPREDIKGDYEVDARGSGALASKESSKQFLFASMNFAANPAFGINPRNLYRELCKADQMDPELIQYSDEEFQRMSAPQPSITDQATAMLKQAQAAQVQADTVLKRIEALFSATQTAALVSAQPALAPAADQTAKSAGFEDMDNPPIIGEPPPGPPVELPQNTHPNFPARPATPEAGMMQGIEGGQ